MIKKILTALILLCVLPIYATELSDARIIGLNEFAFDFNKKIATAEKNLVASPYSLSSVLAILTAGANGNTRTQLLAALHLPNDRNNFFKPLTLSLNQNFIIANALWAQQDLNYKNTFLDQLKLDKSINFYRLNFSQPATATKTINDWVSQKTKGKIENLIPAGALDSMTKLVITNAIYFKGDWLYPFQPEQTELLPFTLKNGDKTNVGMMQQQHTFLYGENDKFQLLQLPYAKNNLAMVVLLPKSTTIGELNKLTATDFTKSLVSSHETDVEVFLPKFKISSTFDNLITTLQELGIKDAFTGEADFSNLVQQPIYVSMIIQKAMIDVDEKGTTAAAATGAVMRVTAIEIPSPPKIFRADHPFMFFIYDINSKLILFMGQVVNPNEEKNL